MDPVLLTDVDVLSGHKHRGSIHDHPGNKYLAELVEKYCEEYINTPTQHRYHITNTIMAKIEQRGGRFLKFVQDDKLILSDERAACGKVTRQLRERGYEKQEERNKQQRQQQEEELQELQEHDSLQPWDGKNKSKRKRLETSLGFALSPQTNRMKMNHWSSSATTRSSSLRRSYNSGKQPTSSGKAWASNSTLRCHNTTTVVSNIHDVDTEDDDDDSLDESGHRSIWQSLERNSERIEDDVSWNKMYSRLQEFYAHQGHTGISPDWKEDVELAEWATRQRHLFREIQVGYRIPTLREENRWNQLQLLKFPLNYEKWHWERYYAQLKDILQGEKYDHSLLVTLPTPLRIWLDHQRHLLHAEGANSLDHNRRERLKWLGVS